MTLSVDEVAALVDLDDATLRDALLYSAMILEAGRMTSTGLQGVIASVYAQGRIRGRAEAKETVTFIVKEAS